MDDILKQVKGANSKVKQQVWKFLKGDMASTTGKTSGTSAKSVTVKPSQKGKSQDIKKPDGSVRPKLRPSSRKPARLPYKTK